MKSKYLFLFTILVLFTSACAYSEPLSAQTEEGMLSVDPKFREFYHILGGEEALGRAITPMYPEGVEKRQYFENCLLIYNPNAAPGEYFQLAPLGTDLGYFVPPPVEKAPEPSGILMNGYVIHPNVMQLYQVMGGEAVLGPPISGPLINVEANRLEQHFENFGFSIALDDPAQTPRPLAYGLAKCGRACQEQFAFVGREEFIPADLKMPQSINLASERLGTDFTGDLLVVQKAVEDGNPQAVYDRIVLYEHNGRVFARPITLELDYQPDVMVGKIENEYIVFVPIQGSLGHNVPLLFYDYIAQHGGIDISGFPITEFKQLGDGVIQQCFTNICLEFNPSLPAESEVSATPLGAQYLQKSQAFAETEDLLPPAPVVEAEDLSENAPLPFEPPRDFNLQVWEAESLLSSFENQTIYAAVFDGTEPLAGLSMGLTLTLANGVEYAYTMPQTSELGGSEIGIPQIVAENGSLVVYTVCILDYGVCETQNFLIWGNHP